MKDRIFNFQQASAFLLMSVRNLRRWVAVRVVPFIKTNFSQQLNGQILFGERRLEDFNKKLNEAKKELDKVKERRDVERYFSRDQIIHDRKQGELGELIEQGLALEIYRMDIELVDIMKKYVETEDEGEKQVLKERLDKESAKRTNLMERLEELEKRRKELFFTLPPELEPKVEMEEWYFDHTGRSAMRMFRPKQRKEGG